MGGNVLEFNDANFKSEVLESPTPVMVDFWHPWCGPCRRLAPTIEKLAGDFQGRLKVGKLDTDQNTETAGGLRITGLPTVVLFQGGKEVGRIVGLNDEAKFKNALANIGVA